MGEIGAEGDGRRVEELGLGSQRATDRGAENTEDGCRRAGLGSTRRCGTRPRLDRLLVPGAGGIHHPRLLL